VCYLDVLFRFYFARTEERTRMANEDRLSPMLLAEWERLAQEGLRGGLLEQAWCRRALALAREVRLLWREAAQAGAGRREEGGLRPPAPP
jgi:hypothetical protein